ncbi:glycosyltransferase [bacterium]|nr:glycosyltransferase [candidate division CSSED10-310 bacterium]
MLVPRLPPQYYLTKQRIARQVRYIQRSLLDRGATARHLTDHPADCLLVYESDCASTQYRVNHTAQLLESRNLNCRLIDLETLDRINRFTWLANTRLVFLHRLPMTPALARFIHAARRRRIPVVLDLDDAVHTPALYRHSAIYDVLSPLEKRIHDALAIRVGKTLDRVDAITVSTQPLMEQVQSTGKPIFCIPNRVSPSMIEAASAYTSPAHPSEITSHAITLGYLSGTATHHRDFQPLVPVLETIWETYPHVQLLLAGPLNLNPPIHPRFFDRITTLPLKPWPKFLSYYSKLDINLAPLETANPFCEAKSAIKYLEAALLSIPTIASPTHDFRRLITPGKTGFLAHSPDDWLSTLTACISDLTMCRNIGSAAHIHTCSEETIAANSHIWDDILDNLGVFP